MQTMHKNSVSSAEQHTYDDDQGFRGKIRILHEWLEDHKTRPNSSKIPSRHLILDISEVNLPTNPRSQANDAPPSALPMLVPAQNT